MDAKSSCPAFESVLIELCPDAEKRVKLIGELRAALERVVRKQLQRELPTPSPSRGQRCGCQ